MPPISQHAQEAMLISPAALQALRVSLGKRGFRLHLLEKPKAHNLSLTHETCGLPDCRAMDIVKKDGD